MGAVGRKNSANQDNTDIPGYRGVPLCYEEERYWDPQKEPCVPSDHRPALLFNLWEAAEAAGEASRMEAFASRADQVSGEYDFHDGERDEELYELACVKHKHAMHRLLSSFPRSDETHHTRPCPCGPGALAMWPWVVQTAQLGFCECPMAEWERICWRSEWIKAGSPGLAW